MRKTKQIMIAFLCICCISTITSCSKPVEQELTDRIPMVFIDGILYMDTGQEVSPDLNLEIAGTILSSVDGTQTPSKDNESNFGLIGAEYSYYDDGVIIRFDDKWIYFQQSS